MSKSITFLLVLLIAGGLATAYRFGNLGIDQLIYVGNLIGGWTLWVAVVAIIYAGLERLFPNVLCAPITDEPPAPPKDGA